MGLVQMDELVGYNVLDHTGWEGDGPPIEVEIASGDAGAPAIAQIPYYNGARRDTYTVGEEPYATLHPRVGMADIPIHEVLASAIALMVPELEPAVMKSKAGVEVSSSETSTSRSR